MRAWDRDILTQAVAAVGTPAHGQAKSVPRKRPRAQDDEDPESETRILLPESSIRQLNDDEPTSLPFYTLDSQSLSNDQAGEGQEQTEIWNGAESDSTVFADPLSSLWFNPPMSYEYVLFSFLLDRI